MKLAVTEKGELFLDAESPADGLELARIVQEAKNAGAKGEVITGTKGEVSLSLTLALKPGPRKKTKSQDGPETENGDGNRQPETQPEVNDPTPETTR